MSHEPQPATETRAATERLRSPFRRPAAPDPREGGSAAPPSRLELRELTGFEEEYLEAHRRDANTARVCNEVLARCLAPVGEEPGDARRRRVRRMPVAERDRALVRLRRMSLGDVVETRIDCPACGETQEVDFNLDALPLDFETPPEEIEATLGDVTTATLRLPTAGDQEDLLDADVGSAAERRTWILARCVRRLGEEEGPFDPERVHAWPTGVRQALEAALEDSAPELDLSMAAGCRSCGEEFSAPFDLASFFLSELRQLSARLLAEAHRLASRYHWNEREIFSLGLSRRRQYLLLIEEERDAELTSQILTVD